MNLIGARPLHATLACRPDSLMGASLIDATRFRINPASRSGFEGGA